MKRRIDLRLLLALLAVYVIWGSTYLAIRFAVQGLPPMLLGGTRFCAAGGVLLLVQLLRGVPWPGWRQWLMAVPTGGLLFVVGNGLVTVAEQQISSGLAAVVCALMPLCAAAFATLLGERPSLLEWAGIALGFAGVVVLSQGAELRGHPHFALLLFLAPLGWAVGSLLGRRLALPPGLMGAAVQMLAGGVLLLLISLFMGERIPAHPPLRSVAALLYLTVFGSLVGFSAYTYLLRNTRPALATSYAYVNPLLAVVLGALLGAEQLGLRTVLAAVLVVLALICAGLGRRHPSLQERRTHAPSLPTSGRVHEPALPGQPRGGGPASGRTFAGADAAHCELDQPVRDDLRAAAESP